ncbi:MAG: NAD(P)/FAD-dependent oxidoreductase [Bacteroidota bacterium]
MATGGDGVSGANGTAPNGRQKTAVVIGAGPAGLTAAYELLTRTTIRPVLLEATDALGGISQTACYRGNRIDVGGHRFFSKSDRVLDWWLGFMPVERGAAGAMEITYQNRTHRVDAPAGGPDPEETDRVMLVRSRTSRIYFNGQFFDYPVKLSPDTLRKLGLGRSVRIGMSYLKSLARPNRDPQNLEEFFIARFGRELYETFFKEYTEKVWGVPCTEISAEWGAQRVKGLSVGKALWHFAKNLVPKREAGDLRQKGTETSLIERFFYPKFGPGQMWETVAEEYEAQGGTLLMQHRADRLRLRAGRIAAVEAVDAATGERRTFEADYVVSTMPVRSLVAGLDPETPADALPETIRETAAGLGYRDFLTVGLLVDKLAVSAPDGSLIPDNWIYVQEPGVQVGRVQVFNNWSPYMVADPSKVWIGLEYFCNAGDDLWEMDDDALRALAVEELDRIGLLRRADVLDGTVLRMPKAYPAYTGTYADFDAVRDWLGGIENLILVGRNGMHRYNNQDHSMLAAMTAVDNLASGRADFGNVWAVNTEQEYHEEKSG